MSQQKSGHLATPSHRLVPPSTNPIPGATYSNASRWDRVKDDRIIRIFLSSTLRDMQRERDIFFQYGEPRLRGWAKKKGLVLDFIDLRWGLANEVSSNGEIIIHQYESIERCPYFLCTLGSRYGWIPDHSKPSEWHADTDKRYPFLKEYGDLSVTHYEIKYGALKKNPVARRAFFYERDEAYVLANTDDLTAEERILYQAANIKDRMNQNAMKQEIRQQFDVKMYQSARELTELIVDDMIGAFEVDFGDMKNVSEDEDLSHEHLMRQRLYGFEGRTEMLGNLTKNVKYQLGNNTAKICVIGAESGVGKSSVMAALARELKKDSSLHVISHFVGCSNLSQYVESMNQRVYRLLFDRQGFADPLDSEQGKEIIKKGLDEILKQASMKSRFSIVLLVDAVNQLVDSQDYPHVHQLNWLPKSLPKNVALVVSTIDTHASCQAASKAGLEITPLSRLSANEAIQAAVSFMKNYDKALSQVQKDFILQHIKDTGHPLYLRIILDEMRVFGVFEMVNQELQELLKTNGVLELYNLVVSRWEKQYNTIRFTPQSPMTSEIVGKVISVLRVSRIGLDDNELDDYIAHLLGRKLVGEEISIWKSFFFKLIDSLFVRNGRYMISNHLLGQVVQNRYLSNPDVETNEKKMYGLWLLGRYDPSNTDAAVVAEICHSLCFGNEYAKLERFLANEKVVTLMLDVRYKYEFYSCWRVLNKNGFNHKRTYGEMAKEFTDAGGKLVAYFQDLQESDFLTPIIQARVQKNHILSVAPTFNEADKLGEGGQAKVYKGTFEGKPVAIKDIQADAESMKDAADEVILTKKIPHQNIINIIGVYLSPQGMLIVMELGSDSLKAMIDKKKGPLSPIQIVTFGKQIADALNYCVTQNPKEPIHHRDLKTENVLIVNGQAKLADFGLAHTRQRVGPTRVSATKSGAGADGTKHWQGPEIYSTVCKGNTDEDAGENVGHRGELSDVFAFGLLLWSMATGKYPFVDRYSDQVPPLLFNRERPEIPADVHPTLAHIIRSCWRQNYKKRPRFSKVVAVLSMCGAGNLDAVPKEDLNQLVPIRYSPIDDMYSGELYEYLTEQGVPQSIAQKLRAKQMTGELFTTYNAKKFVDTFKISEAEAQQLVSLQKLASDSSSAPKKDSTPPQTPTSPSTIGKATSATVASPPQSTRTAAVMQTQPPAAGRPIPPKPIVEMGTDELVAYLRGQPGIVESFLNGLQQDEVNGEGFLSMLDAKTLADTPFNLKGLQLRRTLEAIQELKLL